MPTIHRMTGIPTARNVRTTTPNTGIMRGFANAHAWRNVIFLPMTICATVVDRIPFSSATARIEHISKMA